MTNDALYSSLYNPDVLSCLANLSNDEVFTPPSVVNAMLDMLPQELFRNPTTTFLDPATKSGVFLREIAKRLIDGLADQIPDLQERLDHIYHKQVFGIAITEITSLLSRRSLYCSKFPNSEYSVSRFTDGAGNVQFARIQHRWQNGKCVFCGANRSEYDRDASLETHAYEWIHTTKPEELFKMKFDVIISNPPYQLSDGGGVGTSALPIYNLFVEQSIKLNPRFLSMIIPARWFTGGRGLDSFRNTMLNDSHLRIIHDYQNASDCFQGVEIKGGVCYFLWDRDNRGDCKVYTHVGNEIISCSDRPLLEEGMSTFIRNNELISILRKVQSKTERSFAELVSANDPFGFDVREENSYKRIKPEFSLRKDSQKIAFYYNGWRKNGVGYVQRSMIRKGIEMLDRCKVYIPKAWGNGNPEVDWIKPFIVDDASCCTETYLVVGPFDNHAIAENVVSYMQTKFFHAMVSLMKITQNTMQKAYSFVPLQDFSEDWTDTKLYSKYGLTQDEVEFIESMIRPMDTDGGDEDA